jgi:putative flippase GtrA
VCGTFARFAVIGAANTAIHYGVYLRLWLVMPYLAAHLVATCVAIACSYLLNCRFTFGVPPRLKTFLLFPLSNLTNVVVTTTVAYLSVDICGLDSRVAPLVGGSVAVPATFLVSKVVLTGPTVGARIGHLRSSEALSVEKGGSRT